MISPVIIFGGTGTLGSEIAKNLPAAKGVTVFSRDEQKQQAMRAKYPDFRYIIGDIRDRVSVDNAMKGHRTVFHVAAMKHVDVVEANVHEAIQTNLNGSLNIANSALVHKIDRVLFSSTDKAVLPINIYGHTKAIVERFYLNANKYPGNQTKFSVFRWGNVVGSRGSVVHSFVKSIVEDHTINLTHYDMTRFWILIEDAVNYMLTAEHSPSSALYPQMKAASVLRMANAIATLKGVPSCHINVTGIRPGEKIHECIDSNHDFCVRSDTAPQLTDEELDAMLRRVL